MIIRHNLSAMNAENMFSINNTKLGKSLQKLASGYEINSAADNAAGLAVSEKMRAQIKGINQAVKNAQDGISYVQTAEGALQEIHSILQRGRTLSVQVANGTYDNVDRDAVQLEMDQLRSEIDLIADTDFNGLQIFDTTGTTIFDPDPFNTEPERPNIKYSELSDPSSFGVDLGNGSLVPFAVRYDSLASGNGYFNEPKNYALSQVAADLGVSESEVTRFANEIKNTYLPTLLSGIVKALPQSSVPTVSGMTIGFNFYNQNNNSLANVTSDGSSSQLNINVKYLSKDASGKITMSDDLAGTVAHEMMHAVMFDTVTNAMGVNSRVEGLPHWVTEGLAQAVGGGMDYCFDAGSPLAYDFSKGTYVPRDDETIKNYLAALKTADTPAYNTYYGYSRGYIAMMYLGYEASGGTGEITSSKVASGLDAILKSVADGHSFDSAVAHYTKFSSTADFLNKFDNADAVNFTKKLINAVYGSGNRDAVGSIIASKLSDDKGDLLSITGKNNFFTLDLDSDWGKDLINDFHIPANKVYEGGGTSATGTGRGGTAPGKFAPVKGGGNGNTEGIASYEHFVLQLNSRSKDAIDFTFKYSANNIGDLERDLNCTTFGLGLYYVSMRNQESANEAIDKFDFAINKVSMMRATYGAIQNRLEHKVDNLNNTSENITASESRIRDADMAKEMMEFTKNRILSSASQSMLAQANSVPQNILSLIGQ